MIHLQKIMPQLLLMRLSKPLLLPMKLSKPLLLRNLLRKLVHSALAKLLRLPLLLLLLLLLLDIFRHENILIYDDDEFRITT